VDPSYDYNCRGQLGRFCRSDGLFCSYSETLTRQSKFSHDPGRRQARLPSPLTGVGPPIRCRSIFRNFCTGRANHATPIHCQPLQSAQFLLLSNNPVQQNDTCGRRTGPVVESVPTSSFFLPTSPGSGSCTDRTWLPRPPSSAGLRANESI
jgi:hypothetical protein